MRAGGAKAPTTNPYVRYLRAGAAAGTPLVLLHGGGIDSATLSWGELIEPLGARRPVFAPDLPGYGESDRPPDAPYTLPYFAQIVLDFADALGLDQFDVAGLSMGGGIALTLALDHPERVRRLVLVDTYGLQRTYPPQLLSWLLVRLPLVTELTALSTRNRAVARASLAQLVKTPAALTDELVDEVMREARKPGAGRAFNALQRYEVQRGGLRTCYMDRLGEITAPTLIVHGAADTLVPLALAEEACRRIPDCRPAVFAGAGHWAQRERPAEFLAAVTEFLED